MSLPIPELLLLLAPALTRAVPGPQESAAALEQDSAAALVEEIVSRGEEADPDRIRELANLRTEEALDGLLAAYGVMQSIYMRRVVLQGLVLFDEVPGLERRALQTILDAATTSAEAEMRAIAVDLLAGCANYGKAFLAMIVESAADDDARELALRHHAGDPRPEDFVWYRELVANGGSKRRAPAEDGTVAQRPRRLEALRAIAFNALRGSLSVGELATFHADRNEEVRGLALEELGSRADPTALEMARSALEQVSASPRDRLRAARILLGAEGPRIAERLIRVASDTSSEELAFGIADLLADTGDAGIEAELAKLVGQGKGLALRFSMRAARSLDDPAVDAALTELATHRDPATRRDALALLAERRAQAALPRLEKLLDQAKHGDLPDLLTTIGAIRGNEPEWLARLETYAESEGLDVRNGVLAALGGTGDPRWLPTLAAGLESEAWSTRLAAARAIEAVRVRQSVWLLVNQLEKESGRLALEISEMLFRLTGKPFGRNAGLWAEWWRNEGFELDPLDPAELEKVEREAESRRLREVTRSTFFGLRILSERVGFVIDVSGSMLEPTRGRYIDEQGEPRIEKAKAELLRALEGLERTALFNIVTFSDGTDSFAERSQEVNAKTLASAQEFVRGLGAHGGTNLHAALSVALEDPDIDTIYVLSDGEPTVGDIVDPGAIRAAIARKNRHLGVVFHCIAVGGKLHLLEDLARDSGGTYVQFP
jgi:HEAT repeat protein